MTRIIAGQAGSLRLQVPRSLTRPTSDRVREAMFSAIQARREVTGTAVLDLYAGSGALGLEAISRGASRLVAVESRRDACQVIRANAAAVCGGLDHSVDIRVACQLVTRAIESLSPGEHFDLVFIDPPYADPGETVVSLLESLRDHIAPGGLVLVERSSRDNQPLWPGWLGRETDKTYGETRVVILSR